ncbi:MAG: DUF928 domain-containing protein [Limnospira maxima]|uniref:DUF928 domain-containing protein n=1 Tax=Limnospira indica TaxID=147322 RepID=UPI0008FFBC06|nr:DUF928 domain-containing protein [Limnospira indica]
MRESLNFQLPDRGRPGDRSSSAGARGNCTRNTQITALVPTQNWGYTLSAHPKFWFYLTASKDSSWSAEFELQDPRKNRLVEFSLTVNPGLIAVTLPEDIYLEETETNYYWRLSIICEPSDRTGDLVVRGEVLKRELDQDLQAQIRDKSGRDLALVYAANSIWFDLLTLVMKFREEQPENPIYREDWQELLGAIDLPKSIIENGEF